MSATKAKESCICGRLRYSVRYIEMVVIAFIMLISFTPISFATTDAEVLKMAEQSVNEMSAAGFTITQINQTLSRAKTLFLSGDYQSAVSLANQINLTKEKAFAVSRQIDEADSGIIELSADTARLRETLRLATIEFYNENYLEAENYANRALEMLEALKSSVAVESAAKPDVFADFIRDNWYIFAVIPAILIIYRFIFYNKMKMKNMRRRLKYLDETERRTKGAVKKAQEDYFSHGLLDKYEYHVKMSNFRKHLAAIKKERIIINRELKGKKYDKYKALAKAKV